MPKVFLNEILFFTFFLKKVFKEIIIFSDNIMNSSNSSNKTGGGNNISPPATYQISPAKRWCFTANNYTQSLIDEIVPKFQKVCTVAGFSKEVGESGTPHLQGYVEFKTKCRPSSHEFPKGIHWAKCKGNRDSNVKYITKDGPMFFNLGLPKPPKPVKLINPDYEWEQEILEVLKDEPDDRTIYWYWSRTGNKGKTSFCKYLTIKHGAIALSGKSADMKNGIVKYQEVNGTLPELILIPIPKSFNTDYLNYEGIECVKDMYFFSGKYEGGQVCGNPPHLFVFANEPPDTSKMMIDRWRIREIE